MHRESVHGDIASDHAMVARPIARVGSTARCRQGARGAPRSFPATGRLEADRGEPGLQGDGGRHLGPQDPRARVRSSSEDGTFHLWYTGYNDDRPPTMSLGHATSPDGLHWTRDPAEPDLQRVVGRRYVRRPAATASTRCSPRARTTSPTGSPRPTACTGPTTARSTSARPTARRSAPAPTARRPPGSRTATWYLFYERGDQGVWLATSPRPQDLDQRQGRPGHRHGPRAYDRPPWP